MKFRITSFFTVALSVPVLAVSLVSAHVVVTPKTAITAERTTFSISVPNEESVPVTELKIIIPSGVKEVAPTVHPGWTIETAKTGEDVTSITWKGGEVPAGQRDDFTFRAQTPERTGELQWKAYQTYADGKTVSWDQTPTDTESESETSGPYSVTKVNDDSVADSTDAEAESGPNALPLFISLAAFILGLVAILRTRKKSV